MQTFLHVGCGQSGIVRHDGSRFYGCDLSASGSVGSGSGRCCRDDHHDWQYSGITADKRKATFGIFVDIARWVCPAGFHCRKRHRNDSRGPVFIRLRFHEPWNLGNRRCTSAEERCWRKYR